VLANKVTSYDEKPANQPLIESGDPRLPYLARARDGSPVEVPPL